MRRTPNQRDAAASGAERWRLREDAARADVTAAGAIPPDRGAPAPPGYLTLLEAAKAKGVHRSAVYAAIRSRRLTAQPDGSRWVVDAAEVASWVPDATRQLRRPRRAAVERRLLDLLPRLSPDGQAALVAYAEQLVTKEETAHTDPGTPPNGG